jgi:FlaA1/EpsC-like NDP-sugar epimerase
MWKHKWAKAAWSAFKLYLAAKIALFYAADTSLAKEGSDAVAIASMFASAIVILSLIGIFNLAKRIWKWLQAPSARAVWCAFQFAVVAILFAIARSFIDLEHLPRIVGALVVVAAILASLGVTWIAVRFSDYLRQTRARPPYLPS